MAAYYNDNDSFVCAWLKELIKDGLITDGEVDDRSILDVSADDLRGFERVHLFAGIGGWDHALNLAGWEGPVWTGSCPCPPFSAAGKQFGCPQCAARRPVPCPRRTGYFICWNCGHAWLADGRHLWPEFWRLVRDGRPAVVMGEQVASADGRIWLAGVRASLEILGYASWAADLPAAGVGAPHNRPRIFWVADSASMFGNCEYDYSECCTQGKQEISKPRNGNRAAPRNEGGMDMGEPPVSVLADEIPGLVGATKAYGNAIVPQVAAEFIAAYMET